MGTTESEESLYRLTKEFLKKKYEKPGNVYLGVVSRIDSFVSGVLVFAKTSKAASRLSEQFRNGKVKKSYVAIVEGKMESPSGHLKSWMRKNDRLRRVESFPQEVNGSKFAELRFQVRSSNLEFSLLEIELITGRKHQIRSQLSDLGSPVFGDRKYDGIENFGNGIALHAHKLKISHPTKKTLMEFVDPIPDRWKQSRKIALLLPGFPGCVD